jgi:hypothetical protein
LRHVNGRSQTVHTLVGRLALSTPRGMGPRSFLLRPRASRGVEEKVRGGARGRTGGREGRRGGRANELAAWREREMSRRGRRRIS